MKPYADLSFNIDPKALAVLALLSKDKRSWQNAVETYPFYAGKVKGVALVAYDSLIPSGPCRVVIFGEEPTTTKVFATWYDLEGLYHGVLTLHDLEWVNKDTFFADDIMGAVLHITDLLDTFARSTVGSRP